MINPLNTVADERDKYRLMAAITAMKPTRNFELFVAFLETVSQHIDRDNRTALAPELQWQQGAAQFIEELLRLVQDAEPLAATFREQASASGNPGNSSLSKF